VGEINKRAGAGGNLHKLGSISGVRVGGNALVTFQAILRIGIAGLPANVCGFKIVSNHRGGRFDEAGDQQANSKDAEGPFAAYELAVLPMVVSDITAAGHCTSLRN
jgi:hypothetical protein